MRRLNLDQLQALNDVVQLGSFSAAAERRGLTQPAVSLQVRQLEERLGIRLVERGGKRVRATAAGLVLIERAKRIDEAVADALESVAEHRSGISGRVSLGTGATVCIYVLPPILKELRRAYPGLEIVVSTGNSPEILKALEENRIDAALVTMPVPGRSLRATPVLNDELVAVFPMAEAPMRASVTAAMLAERPVILYEAGGHARGVIDRWFKAGGRRCRPIMELGSVEAIKKLVEAGLGAAVLPRLAVADPSLTEGMAIRPLRPRVYRRLALVLRRDKHVDRGLGELVRAIGALAPSAGRGAGATARP
ncbi:MAG: LysR family transcriptional regulator [Proteobacteria bacterium]|nr:LysR family transcriptional regulator [Pseudomonadota bacterium]MBI3498209.1 LysR family transcriptional regulator [Pseudomonadota bacterium]